MADATLCTTCRRTVYIEVDDTPVCPVCSSPLLNAADLDSETPAATTETSDEPTSP